MDFKKLIAVVMVVVFAAALLSTFANVLTQQQTLGYINETFNPLWQSHIYTLDGKTITNDSIFVVNVTTGVPYVKDVDYNFTTGDYHTFGTLGWLHSNISVVVGVNYTYQPANYISPTSSFALIVGLFSLVIVCGIILYGLRKFGIV
jgi:hypothetical protein